MDGLRHRSRMDLLLLASAAITICLTIYFGLRLGDSYRIGDSEYRRGEISDLLAVFIPGLAMTVSLLLLALRQLSGGSITGQWRRERELLKEARRWDKGDPWQ